MTKRPSWAAGRSSKSRTGKDLLKTIPAATVDDSKPRCTLYPPCSCGYPECRPDECVEAVGADV